MFNKVNFDKMEVQEKKEVNFFFKRYEGKGRST